MWTRDGCAALILHGLEEVGAADHVLRGLGEALELPLLGSSQAWPWGYD
jgi:hypothetical protein